MSTSFISSIIIIGSGPSSGVPVAKCFIRGCREELGPCSVCMQGVMDHASDAYRLNPTTLLEISTTASSAAENNSGDTSAAKSKKRVLIDFGKTMRQAIIRFFAPRGITSIDAVLCTHPHADAYMGMEELLVLLPKQKSGAAASIPLYTDDSTLQTIDHVFPGLVAPPSVADSVSRDAALPAAAATAVVTTAPFSRNVVTPGTIFEIEGVQTLPVYVCHGVQFNCLGFIFSLEKDGKLKGGAQVCVFFSDVAGVSEEVYTLISRFKPKVAVIDLLRYKPLASHFGKDDAIDSAKRIGAEKTFWVGTSHGIDRMSEQKVMPGGMLFSRDGMQIYSRN